MTLARALLAAALVLAAGYGALWLLRGMNRPDDALAAVRCWFETPASRTAECYRFTTPESRGTASNRNVELPVVVLRSPSTPPGEPPVLHLMGGPGQPAGIADTAQIGDWVRFLDRVAWARDRDHVLIDVRGAGMARPFLRCDILSDPAWLLSVQVPSDDPAAQRAAVHEAVGACRDRFAGQGVDLSAYDTAATAGDLAALRRALKLKSWTVYAVSYGTRPALELMRRDADGVHAAVLDSVNPPDEAFLAARFGNLRRGLDLLYADCAAQHPCAGAYPDLADDMRMAVTRLREAPAALDLREPGGTRMLKVTLDDTLFLEIVDFALMSGAWVSFLPGIINEAGRGGTVLVGHLAARLVFDGYWKTHANALLLSALCREELPFNPEAAIAQAARSHPLMRGLEPDALLRAECAAWPAGTAPAAFRKPVESAVPTLLINGAYDTRTPAAVAERVAGHLPLAYRIVIRGRGHSPSPVSPCAQAAIAAFLDAPRDPVAPACIANQTPPRFMMRGGPSDRVRRL